MQFRQRQGSEKRGFLEGVPRSGFRPCVDYDPLGMHVYIGKKKTA